VSGCLLEHGSEVRARYRKKEKKVGGGGGPGPRVQVAPYGTGLKGIDLILRMQKDEFAVVLREIKAGLITRRSRATKQDGRSQSPISQRQTFPRNDNRHSRFARYSSYKWTRHTSVLLKVKNKLVATVFQTAPELATPPVVVGFLR